MFFAQITFVHLIIIKRKNLCNKLIFSILSTIKGELKKWSVAASLKKNPANKKNMENSFDQEDSWSSSV